MKRRMLFIAALFATAMFAAPADTPPDLSGEWKLNLDKSNFGPMPPPTSATRKIEHKEPSLHVISNQKSEMGDWDSDLNMTTDGKESTGTIKGPQGDIEIKSTAKWEGKVLNATHKANFGGTDVTNTEKWSLSEDGKTLTIEQKFSTPQGDFEGTQVYEKTS